MINQNNDIGLIEQIEEMMQNLYLGDYGNQITNAYYDHSIRDAFWQIAECNINNNYQTPMIYVVGHSYIFDETSQQGQSLYIREDLDQNKEDIIKYYILDYILNNFEQLNIQNIEQIEKFIDNIDMNDENKLSNICENIDVFFKENSLDDLVNIAESQKSNQEKSNSVINKDDLIK